MKSPKTVDFPGHKGNFFQETFGAESNALNRFDVDEAIIEIVIG